MNIIDDFIQSSAEFTTIPDLTDFTYNFLTDAFPDIELTLLTHRLDEVPLKIIKSTHTLRDLTSFSAQLKNKTTPERIFQSSELVFDPLFIFICERTPSLEQRDILRHWQNSCGQLCKGYRTGREDCMAQMGDLIAQLLHDIHSLMDCSNETKNPKYIERISYQDAVNKNLLFFVRDLELFKTEFSIRQFFKDTLADMTLIPGSIDISVDPEIPMLSADMELLSKAINEIIKNALHATNDDPSGIKIKAETIWLNSPFLEDPWLRISILDSGKGISEDFIPFIKKPFFTTDKYLGHSGFGLAIADKVIRAHDGFMTISSTIRKQTLVTVYLRGLNYDKKE